MSARAWRACTPHTHARTLSGEKEWEREIEREGERKREASRKTSGADWMTEWHSADVSSGVSRITPSPLSVCIKVTASGACHPLYNMRVRFFCRPLPELQRIHVEHPSLIRPESRSRQSAREKAPLRFSARESRWIHEAPISLTQVKSDPPVRTSSREFTPVSLFCCVISLRNRFLWKSRRWLGVSRILASFMDGSDYPDARLAISADYLSLVVSILLVSNPPTLCAMSLFLNQCSDGEQCASMWQILI